MSFDIPDDWAEALKPELDEPYITRMGSFVAEERLTRDVYPPEADVFNAFRYSSYSSTRVVIIGQDPYHGPGQAHGLAFSVRPGVKPPPSLVNIFKELRSDIGCPVDQDGSLVGWARQGVLLLNTVLTVRAGEANSHKGMGWERFTDAVIQRVSRKRQRVVFLLWGGPAQKKQSLIDREVHTILAAPHPSPLSAYHGFFGSKPFSQTNEALRTVGEAPIDWCRRTE